MEVPAIQAQRVNVWRLGETPRDQEKTEGLRAKFCTRMARRRLSVAIKCASKGKNRLSAWIWPYFSKIRVSLTFDDTQNANFVSQITPNLYDSKNAREFDESIFLSGHFYGAVGAEPVHPGSVVNPMASAEELPKFSDAPFPDRKLNFLLVDDDTICQFIHGRVLELSRYCNSAQSALNGKQALGILGQAAAGGAPVPDIILLDLQMPLMNGLEFLRAFRNMGEIDRELMAVVLLSSSESPEDRRQATALGASHFMSKPFTNEKLDALISILYPESTLIPAMVAPGLDRCPDTRMRN